MTSVHLILFQPFNEKISHIGKQLIFGANESSHGLHVAIPTSTAKG